MFFFSKETTLAQSWWPPDVIQGWWSYAHYQTARPHLSHDIISLSRSLMLSTFRLQKTDSPQQTESFSASQLSLHPAPIFHHFFWCHQSKISCQSERGRKRNSERCQKNGQLRSCTCMFALHLRMTHGLRIHGLLMWPIFKSLYNNMWKV